MKGNVKLPDKCRLGGFKIRHEREFYIYMKEEFYFFCLTSHFSLIPYLKKALVSLRNVPSIGLPIFTFEYKRLCKVFIIFTVYMLKVEVIFILNEFNDLFSGPFLKKVADFFKNRFCLSNGAKEIDYILKAMRNLPYVESTLCRYIGESAWPVTLTMSTFVFLPGVIPVL